MADITMCRDSKCPQRNNCYRYLAIPNPYRQSYFVESPKKMDGCPYFMKATEEEKKAYNAYCIGHRNGSITQEDPSGSH